MDNLLLSARKIAQAADGRESSGSSFHSSSNVPYAGSSEREQQEIVAKTE